ncbi:MAG TPA: tyrosine-type recombinase/integrase [Kiritimatiellia bacterium]|nr:tyrosine-type recombinase/integrase [Kiritimatiellia bacterium]
MAPIRAADGAEALRAVQSRLMAAVDTAGKLNDEAHPPLSLLKAWTAYQDSENRPQSGVVTLAGYEGHWAAFCEWLKEHQPGAQYMRDVTPEMAAAFIRQLSKKGYSGNRINKFVRFLETFFRVLAKTGRVTVNPFEDITRRKQVPESKRPFTIEELKRIIETAEGELQTLFMLGTFTGLRLGDAATLQWGEVDLARAIIRRVPRKTAHLGKAVIIGIPAILGEHLAGLKRKGPFVTPETAAQYEVDAPGLSRRIQDHLINCGIQTIKPGTGFEIVKGKDGKPEERYTGKRAVVVAGFHSLRHTFVSLHAQAGTPQAVMMKLAGHGNPMMTEHYTHISEATARSAAAALPAIVGKAAPVKVLPPANLAERVKQLAGKLTPKNAGTIRKELLALVS